MVSAEVAGGGAGKGLLGAMTAVGSGSSGSWKAQSHLRLATPQRDRCHHLRGEEETGERGDLPNAAHPPR